MRAEDVHLETDSLWLMLMPLGVNETFWGPVKREQGKKQISRGTTFRQSARENLSSKEAEMEQQGVEKPQESSRVGSQLSGRIICPPLPRINKYVIIYTIIRSQLPHSHQQPPFYSSLYKSQRVSKGMIRVLDVSVSQIIKIKEKKFHWFRKKEVLGNFEELMSMK